VTPEPLRRKGPWSSASAPRPPTGPYECTSVDEVNSPKNRQKYQLWGFLILVAAVLILIGGAVAQSSVLNAIGMSALVVGAVAYIAGRYEPRKPPKEDGAAEPPA